MKDWLAHFPLDDMPRLTHIGYRAHQSPHIGKLHTHFGYEIKLIMKGHAVLQLTGEKGSIRVREGDILIVPPGFVHWSTMRSGALSYYWFGVQTGTIVSRSSTSEQPVVKRRKRTTDIVEERSSDRMFASLNKQLPTQWTLFRDMHDLNAPMRSIHDEIVYPRAANAVIVYAQTMEILARIVRRMTREESPDNDPIRRIEHYLTAHYLETPALGKLAAVSGLNQSYLCRIFKWRFGVSPIAYANRLRLRHGMSLLSSGMSVTEAARLCGYGNALHFSAAFKKKTGSSPSLYKKNIGRPTPRSEQ